MAQGVAQNAQSQPVYLTDYSGNAYNAGSSGGGVGGDATKANQSTQIDRATELNRRIGDTSNPDAGSSNGLLTVISSRVGDLAYRGTPTDVGALVGTSAVTLANADPARRYVLLQNQSDTANVYVNFIATATTDFHSLMLAPGGTYESPINFTPIGAISVISTAANTPVYGRTG